MQVLWMVCVLALTVQFFNDVLFSTAAEVSSRTIRSVHRQKKILRADFWTFWRDRLRNKQQTSTERNDQCPEQGCLTPDDVNQMKEVLNDEIKTWNRAFVDGSLELPLMAGCIRLVFHDCVGKICDGCVDLSNKRNAGLKRYIDHLNDIMSENYWKNKISVADFWSLCAIVSMEVGAELTPISSFNPNKSTPRIRFKYGRRDHGSPCPSNNYFPNTHDHPVPYLVNEFGISKVEAVALMGAHTVGRAHKQASGYDHAWTPFPDWLDNQFFRDLRDPELGWYQINIRKSDGTRRIQWDNIRHKPALMLHADVQLYKQLQLSERNNVTRSNCRYRSCPNSSTYGIVVKFAADNDHFMEIFSAAMDRMMSVGNNGNLREVIQY